MTSRDAKKATQAATQSRQKIATSKQEENSMVLCGFAKCETALQNATKNASKTRQKTRVTRRQTHTPSRHAKQTPQADTQSRHPKQTPQADTPSRYPKQTPKAGTQSRHPKQTRQAGTGRTTADRPNLAMGTAQRFLLCPRAPWGTPRMMRLLRHKTCLQERAKLVAVRKLVF